MADININNNDYVEFIISTPFGRSRKVSKGPGGWDNEGLELDRHKTYHGIFTEFVESLTFYDEDAEYIYDGFKLGGINVNCYLLKRSRREVDGEVKFVDDYLGIADFKKYERGENYIKLNFNSHNLEETIKSHESDEFEMDRKTSIDDAALDELIPNRIGIEGRSIYGGGESVVSTNGLTQLFTACVFNLGKSKPMGTSMTKLISKGSERHSAVENTILSKNSERNIMLARYGWETSSNSFFTNVQSVDGEHNLKIKYNVHFTTQYGMELGGFSVKVFLGRFKYNLGSNDYSLIERTELYQAGSSRDLMHHMFSGEISVNNIAYDELLCFVYHYDQPLILPGYNDMTFGVIKQDMKVDSISFYDSSPNLRFMFVSDVYKRLMYILTGSKNKFYSKFFGRTEDGYAEDGEGGLIGLISGFWVRAFNESSEKYKALTISLKDLFESTEAMFNLGATVEINGFEERFRVEEKSFFYQNRVSINLPYIVEEKETLDSKMYFSSIEVGFEKGGDYENEIGLDEPNIKSNYVTPIRKSSEKYVKVSKIRADETGLELTRRKPQMHYPEEDTSGDDSNWFLDVKRTIGTGFAQKEWDDRLQEIPQGIHDPTNFKSAFFTPLRMLLRHGYILSSGMLQYRDRFIKYISSKGNINLTTWFIGEDRAFSESEENLRVSELKAPIMTPEIIKFKHPLDQDLIDLIKGKTEIMYKGSIESVPNVFFKFRWKNSKGETRTGHMLNIKLKSEGEFTMQLSNENIL